MDNCYRSQFPDQTWNLTSRGFIVLYKDLDGKMKVWPEQYVNISRADEIVSVIKVAYSNVSIQHI